MVGEDDVAVLLLVNRRWLPCNVEGQKPQTAPASNPRKTVRDRAAYIARHRVNENHNDPLTPGALSRWLLWGESRSLARNTAAFRRRFRLQ